MTKNIESKNIDQLMAEADELVSHINSDVFEDMEEVHRVAYEKHAQKLKEIKSQIQCRKDRKEKSKFDSGAEGMHEAFLDIVKAMGELKDYLT